jgi:putative Holliday junction resolvase
VTVRGSLIGVDYGERRVGIAVSDPTGTIASPRLKLERRGAGLAELVDRLALLVQNEEAVGVVIGDPRHMSGEASPGSAAAAALAAALAARAGVPVWLWDERLTSVVAAAALGEGNVRGRAQRARVDAVAAALILQNFLDAHRERPLPPGVPPAGGAGPARGSAGSAGSRDGIP